MNFASATKAGITTSLFVGSDIAKLQSDVQGYLDAQASTVYLLDISISGAGHGQEFMVQVMVTGTTAYLSSTKPESDANWYVRRCDQTEVLLAKATNEIELNRAINDLLDNSVNPNQPGHVEVAGSSKGQSFAIMMVTATVETVAKA